MKIYAAYTDEELFALLKNSDDVAFTEIYERYWEQLFGMAYNRLKDVQAAEDAVHDIFASLWKSRERLNIQSLKSYLAVSLKYIVLRIVYRNNLFNDYSNRQLSNSSSHATLNSDEQELLALLKKEIDKLPEKCKVIFQLSRISGFSNKEIADEMDISVKTVENQINTAQRRLRIALKNFFFLLISVFTV